MQIPQMATFRSNYLFGETFVTRMSYGCPKYFLIRYYGDRFDHDDAFDENENEDGDDVNGDDVDSDDDDLLKL